MDVNPVNESTASPITATAPIESEEMSEFLLLLTAQIENQDPLDPLDANQFIEQLATINSLEQQIETNERLDEVIDILRTNTEDSA